MRTALATSSLVWRRASRIRTLCGPTVVVKNTRCQCVFALQGLQSQTEPLVFCPLAGYAQVACTRLTMIRGAALHAPAVLTQNKARPRAQSVLLVRTLAL